MNRRAFLRIIPALLTGTKVKPKPKIINYVSAYPKRVHPFALNSIYGKLAQTWPRNRG